MDGLLQRKRRSLFSFVVVHPLFLAFFLTIFSGKSVGVSSGLTHERIQKYLEKINKPAVMSIQSQDGDIIDCIDQWKQLAFDHPLLKNHTLQMVPTEKPKVKRMKGDKVKMYGRGRAWQLWHQNGTRCPKGTVPVKRVTIDDVLRTKFLNDFGRKQSKLALGRHAVSRQGHEYATATVQRPEIYGTVAWINLWNPSLQLDSEMSISQIWVAAGPLDGDLNTIEAGWQVNPTQYDDKSSRFFIYWTADGYTKTGCYNLLCPGFVQVDKNIIPGTDIGPVSTISGKQYEIKLDIRKDPKTKNWWLSYGDNIAVGYWPAELFTHLKEKATIVEWGGEIVNEEPNGAHTSTQMGSGHFAEEGPGKASYFRNLGLVDSNNGIIDILPQDLSVQVTNSNCYSINVVSNHNEWGTHFYYGGPGFNPKCP